MTHRLNKLESVLKREVSKIIQTIDQDLNSVISITSAKLSVDKKYLKVYWYSAVQPEKQKRNIQRYLKNLEKRVRFELAKKIRSLPPPILVFEYDDSIDTIFEIAKVQKILKNEKSSSED